MTTPTNNPARAYTSPELVKLRDDNQWTRYGIVIHKPVTVYSARINQTFSTLDNVIELTYDTGSGTLANVKEGMTVFIGSTAGARDKGVTIIRKTPTGTKFYIRPTSNIQFANNDYITIIDAFPIAGRPIYSKGGVVQMDTDIELGDLTRGGIIPRLGPVAAVVIQESGTLTFTPPNPSLSAAYDGATITGYEFEAPGATATNNMTSETDANWDYPLTADGQYRWNCVITDDLTRETVSYRRVFVNPSEIPFRLKSVQGDLESGSWSFEVTAYADVDDVYDGAMVVLYQKDYHGGVLDNIGKLAGYENIVAVGWIDGETIEQDAQTGWVSFGVYGAGYWMAKAVIDPIELTDTFVEPTTWNQIQEMTVDKILAHVLYWMTTAPLLMDCFFTGDTKRVKAFPVPGGYIMDSIRAIAKDRIFANPFCNNYGQLFISVDPQIATDAARAGFPVAMDITEDDYEGMLDIQRNTSPRTSMLQLSALRSSDGVNDIYLHARAPGNSQNTYGTPSQYQDFIVEDAADCRFIAGRLLAVENNEFEPLTITFPGLVRLFDMAPPMVATITTSGADNPRGIALTNQRLIPRSVQYTEQNGAPRTEVTFEVEVDSEDGVDYFPPTVEEPNFELPPEDFSGVDFPALDDLFPETVPPEVTTPCNRALGNSFTLTWSPRTLTGSTSQLIANAYFPCMIRATGGTAGDTKIIIDYHAFGDADSHKTCYAVNGGTRVLTGTWVGDVITFSPLSDTEITGFEIELDAGAGSVIDRWDIGKLVETGDMGVPTTLCEVGSYYAIEPYTGYWTATTPAEVVGLSFYNFIFQAANSDYRSGVGRDGFGDFHLLHNGLFASVGNDYSETFNPSTQEFETSGNYGRIYFQSTSGAGQQRTPGASATLTLGPTYHGMKWAMYEAQAIGRQLVIGAATLYNVCAIS